jgi:polysaccharide export outer membrane protein
MKKIAILLLLFSFIFAQSTIPLGNVVDPEESDSPNSSRLPRGSETIPHGESAEIRVAQTAPNIPSSQGGEDPQTIPSPLKGEGKGEGDIYLIESGDLLEIIILGEEELSRTLMVMHNGTVSFPLIGEVKVAGLTTEQAAELIAEKLKKYFTQPVVSIIFKSPTLPYVSVFGEVLRQGAVEYQRGLRVTDYIALAGGPTIKANLSKVKVVKFQEGVPLATTINVDDILNKGIIEQNFELKSGDWIHIDKKFTINWGAVLQFATLTLTALNLYITIQRID